MTAIGKEEAQRIFSSPNTTMPTLITMGGWEHWAELAVWKFSNPM
jgi:hypothetical protein